MWSGQDGGDQAGPEHGLGQLRRRLMHAGDDPAAQQLGRDGGEDQEVRHGIGLDNRVRAANVTDGECSRIERGETHAIKRVLTFTALALPDREADHCHAVHHDAPQPTRASAAR